jgi:hypothetical protein
MYTYTYAYHNQGFRDIGICRHMNLVQTHKCSFSIMGPIIFLNRVVLTKLINPCPMVWDSIWDILGFYESKTKEGKRGEKSAIWPILCCRLYNSSIYSSILHDHNKLFKSLNKSSITFTYINCLIIAVSLVCFSISSHRITSHAMIRISQ